MAKNFIRLRLSLEIELSKVGETDFLGTRNQKKTHPKNDTQNGALDQAGAAQPPQELNCLKIQILGLLHPLRVARSSSYFAHLLHTRVLLFANVSVRFSRSSPQNPLFSLPGCEVYHPIQGWGTMTAPGCLGHQKAGIWMQ